MRTLKDIARRCRAEMRLNGYSTGSVITEIKAIHTWYHLTTVTAREIPEVAKALSKNYQGIINRLLRPVDDRELPCVLGMDGDVDTVIARRLHASST